MMGPQFGMGPSIYGDRDIAPRVTEGQGHCPRNDALEAKSNLSADPPKQQPLPSPR